MSITVTAAVGILSKLVGAGLKIYRLSQSGWSDFEKDVEALEAAMSAGGQVSGLFPGAASPRLQARWITLICSAFGEAWSTRFGGFFAMRDKRDLAAQRDVALGQALSSLPAFSIPNLAGQIALVEAMLGDPLKLPVYAALWESFCSDKLLRATGKSQLWETPLIPLNQFTGPTGKADAQHQFECAFKIAYAEAMASPVGQQVRSFLVELPDDITERVLYLLIQDVSTWGQRHESGRSASSGISLPLKKIYVEPLASRRVLSTAVAQPPPAQPVRTLIKQQLVESPLIVVAGDFGHGKSLTARMMAFEQACEYLESRAPAPTRRIPIYVRLGVRNRQLSLPRMVQAALWQQQRFSLKLPLKEEHAAFSIPESSRRTLLLIDGLDELALSEAEQEQFFASLHGHALDEHQIVVFSRPAVLPLRWLGTNEIPVLDLQSFDQSGEGGGQVGEWLRRWHLCAGLSAEEAAHKASEQFERMQSLGLLELARTPILLKMMAQTWRQVAGGDAEGPPVRRADLYERFFQQIARGKLDAETDVHKTIAEASQSVLLALSKQPWAHVNPAKLGSAEDAHAVAAMLWLMSCVAWLSLCVEQARQRSTNRPQISSRRVSELAEQSFETQLNLLLEVKLGIGDANVRRQVRDALLLTLQTSFVGGELHRPLFGHPSFRDFLVARYWENQLHLLSTPSSSPADEAALLDGRFLDPGDVRLSFLTDQLMSWNETTLMQLSFWAQRTFDNEWMAPIEDRGTTPWEYRRTYLREAALAIGSSLQRIIPKDEWTVRSLLGAFWLCEETAIVRAADANLSQSRLARAGLQGADFSRANLTRADLQGANLEGARLTGAILEEASFELALLRDADLRQVQTMRRARLDRANLEYANLEYAKMQQVSLVGANLASASLQFAHLEGADLRGASLAKADLRNALYDAATQWPTDFDVGSSGARLVSQER